MNYDEILPTWSPAELRLHEALYFLRGFEDACGSQDAMDSWLEWVANADAFVMALISTENLVNKKVKDVLKSLDSFIFLKAMRNATVHELPWFAPKQRKGATAPTRRAIYLQVGAKTGRWVQPMNSVAATRRTLTRRRKRDAAKTIDGARRFLRRLRRKSGEDNFLLIDVFEEAFADVVKVCGVVVHDVFSCSPSDTASMT
ncbi:MAG TPA: hypothetical protein VGP76_16925 [Planctomycetaceae bacterium]|nr:hypothetical protein [Planctomycetaceae bacterium]